MFILIAELETSAGIPTKETKAKIETQPVVVEASTCYLLIHFALIL